MKYYKRRLCCKYHDELYHGGIQSPHLNMNEATFEKLTSMKLSLISCLKSVTPKSHILSFSLCLITNLKSSQVLLFPLIFQRPSAYDMVTCQLHLKKKREGHSSHFSKYIKINSRYLAEKSYKSHIKAINIFLTSHWKNKAENLCLTLWIDKHCTHEYHHFVVQYEFSILPPLAKINFTTRIFHRNAFLF